MVFRNYAYNQIIFLGFPKAAGIYPFTKTKQAKDIGPVGNPTGRLYGVRPDRGPNGKRGGSTRFPGKPRSYAVLPNKGGLDTVDSFTFIAWVKPLSPGTILEYFPGGLKIDLPSTRKLRVTLKRRNGKPVQPVKSRNSLKRNRWNFVSVTYNRRRNLVTLWKNARPLLIRNRGWIRLKTNTRRIYIGGSPKSKSFRGSISCVQIYSKALNSKQINSVKDICIEPGMCSILLSYGKCFFR